MTYRHATLTGDTSTTKTCDGPVRGPVRTQFVRRDDPLITRRWPSAILFLVLLLSLVVGGCKKDANVAPPAPYGAVPSERQLAWHELKYYAFVHFGPNTFTDVEWGHGDERPEVFNPSDFDPRQWVRTFKEAGMEGVIITAKHHDGFALWPSELSRHTVRESDWRDGKGDVLRELSDACREYGLKFGVYTSPWDRNHPKYGTDEYNDVFMGMLEEVLTQYGDVFEVWFDGANGEGPNGKRQVYDFPAFAEVVRKHQPNAVIFSDAGPDVRWVGNENGFADVTNWSTIREGAFYPGIPDVNDELQHGHEGGNTWLPAEADVSIRPGWFYHADEDDKVKTVDELAEIWYRSVGMNANLLLNIPVDDRGLVHENDSTRLMEFKAFRDEAFGHNYADGAIVVASNVRGESESFAPERLLDSDRETYWATGDGINVATLDLALKSVQGVKSVLLEEYIGLGQRVESFVIEADSAGSWVSVASGTTIGNRRIVRVRPISTNRIRLSIAAKAPIALAGIEIY